MVIKECDTPRVTCPERFCVRACVCLCVGEGVRVCAGVFVFAVASLEILYKNRFIAKRGVLWPHQFVLFSMKIFCNFMDRC